MDTCFLKNILGKGENAGYQHFVLFPKLFSTLLPQGPEKSRLRGKELNLYQTTIF